MKKYWNCSPRKGSIQYLNNKGWANMNIISTEELNSIYYIYEDLTPNKLYKTKVAFMNSLDMMSPVILKELDEKRAYIYQALTNMWNPHIANVYSIYQISTPPTTESDILQDKYIVVTENVGNTSLSDYVRTNGPLTIAETLSIGIQLCEGLSEFHKKGFIHRDIKPDNIMVSSHDSNTIQVKIIDFGGAKEIQNNKTSDTTIIGTFGYQAPESLSAATKNTADIFSIGCVLNFLLTGFEPGMKRYTEKTSIISIIEKATHIDPSSRYSSVDELKKQLLHEQRFYKLDKIPILRSIPGFRTHTYSKMLTASLIYISVMYIIAIQWLQGYYYESFELLFFYFFTPLIMVCNLGNLLRFIPFNIRSNSKKFFLLRLICVVLALLIPLVKHNL